MRDPESNLVRMRASYPFLTFLEYSGSGVVGLIQNETARVYMIYDCAEIRDGGMLSIFLSLCERWWERTDNSLPIETFIGKRFDVFRPCLRGYSKRGTARVVGPTVSVYRELSGRVSK